MTSFPNAKINIGLNIISKRQDGYHNIESLFYPVGAKDALEFVMQSPGKDYDELIVTGIETGCNMEENFVIKAIKLLRKEYSIPFLKIHLHKVIPPGSGLGGGSSDAAFMLKYLNRYFSLNIDNQGLIDLSLKIGSDCAFFINNKPALIRGRGEVIKEIGFSLEGKYLLLVYPGIPISTAEAYSMVNPRMPDKSIAEGIKQAVSEWRSTIKNDFQDIIIDRYPLIGKIINKIYNEGALYCSLSGSGSTVYGIFEALPSSSTIDDYWTWRGTFAI
ncbi:MAG: 4-(cytidine 5'-diphospho)-2-C-methyl-D-erythritol kinase [Bacteroidota bacterium]|nr:4-(cytidine 5'-diphospho)-2-C-methyl-D-erythritol kinase [Bacteroidota bacterium]